MRLGNLTEMVIAEDLFFSISKKIMLAVGLWPYQQSTLVQIQNTFILGILVAAMIFQVSFINIELVKLNEYCEEL